MKKISTRQKNKVPRYVKLGLSIREIAKLLGCGVETAHHLSLEAQRKQLI